MQDPQAPAVLQGKSLPEQGDRYHNPRGSWQLPRWLGRGWILLPCSDANISPKRAESRGDSVCLGTPNQVLPRVGILGYH